MTLYVAKIWAILLAGEVSAKPSEHNRDPAMATLRYENSFNSGPTNSPEKFIITLIDWKAKSWQFSFESFEMIFQLFVPRSKWNKYKVYK